jgi:hypothetical protein
MDEFFEKPYLKHKVGTFMFEITNPGNPHHIPSTKAKSFTHSGLMNE